MGPVQSHRVTEEAMGQCGCASCNSSLKMLQMLISLLSEGDIRHFQAHKLKELAKRTTEGCTSAGRKPNSLRRTDREENGD